MFTNGRWVFEESEVKKNLQSLMRYSATNPNGYYLVLNWCACQMNGLFFEIRQEYEYLMYKKRDSDEPHDLKPILEMYESFRDMSDRIGMLAFAYSGVVSQDSVQVDGVNSLTTIGKIWSTYECDSIIKGSIGIMNGQHCDIPTFLCMVYRALMYVKNHLQGIKDEIQSKMRPYWKSKDFIYRGPIDILLDQISDIIWELRIVSEHFLDEVSEDNNKPAINLLRKFIFTEININKKHINVTKE